MNNPRRLMHHLYRLTVKAARYLHVYLTLFGFALLLFFAVTGFMLNHDSWFLPQQTIEGKIPRDLLDNHEDRTPLINKLQDDFLVEGELVSFVPEEGAYHLHFNSARGNGTVRVVVEKADGHTLVTHDRTGVSEHFTEHFVDGIMPRDYYEPWSETKKLDIVEKLREEYGVKGKMETFDVASESRSLEVIFKAPGYAAKATISTEDGKTRVKHQVSGLAGLLLDLHRNKNSGEVWSYVVDGVAILFVIVSITGLMLWTSLRARAQHGLAVMALGLGISLAIYYYYVPR